MYFWHMVDAPEKSVKRMDKWFKLSFTMSMTFVLKSFFSLRKYTAQKEYNEIFGEFQKTCAANWMKGLLQA